MKKTFLVLLVLVLGMTLTGCGDNPITGEYKVVSGDLNLLPDQGETFVTITAGGKIRLCTQKKPEGTAEAKKFVSETVMDYKILGDGLLKLSVRVLGKDVTEDATYEITGNKLIIRGQRSLPLVLEKHEKKEKSKMKKTKLFAIIAVLVIALTALAACGGNSANNGLVGKWKFSDEESSKLGIKGDIYLEFKADKTLIMGTNTTDKSQADLLDSVLKTIQKDPATYEEQKDNKVVLKNFMGQPNETMVYKIEGDKLTLTEDKEGGVSQVFTRLK